MVTWVESFDHQGPAFSPAKYVHVLGTYTEVAGPYHGVGARFVGRGNELGPARVASNWDSGAWSGSVRVDATGWSGAGELALLAPSYWTYTSFLTDFPHHWLTVDSAGTLRVRHWSPTVPPPATDVLGASAAGALPLGAWVRLEYRTLIRDTAVGTVEVRVDGAAVLTITGQVTQDPLHLPNVANYIRFGHLQETPDETGGVGGLGGGADAVGVAYDDVCERTDPTAGAAALPWRDDPVAPHRVVCLFPAGPGDAAELLRTGAATNWQACAEAPPDGDASYVEKVAVATSAELPRDLYLADAAPEIVEDAGAGAALFVRGLAGSPDGGPAATATLCRRDGVDIAGGAPPTSTRSVINPGASNGVPVLPYRYLSAAASAFPATLTNAHLAGFQLGWGSHSGSTSGTTQTYRGTQVVAELWYRPGDVAPPEPGAQTWSVGWVG